MKDLSWLRILLGYDAVGLRVGQKLQDAPGQSGLGPQDLQSCDEAVAAKYGVEPGHAGIGVGAFGIAYGHHFQIRFRAANPFAEPRVGSGDAADTVVDPFVEVLGIAEGLLVAARRQTIALAIAPAIATDVQIDNGLGAGLNIHLEKRAFAGDLDGLRVEIQLSLADDPVETAIGELHARRRDGGLPVLAPFFTLSPPDLEDIHEIGVEFVGERKADLA